MYYLRFKMLASCLIIIISVLCFIIPNASSQTIVSNGNVQQVDINSQALCTPPKICVAHYQCLPNDEMASYGDNALNEKVFIKFSDNIKPNFTSVDRGSGVIAKLCGHLEKCCMPPKNSAPPVATDVNVTKGCGIRNPGGISFEVVTNDTSISQYAEFPWTVALLRKNPTHNTAVLKCGGSLIHPSVVLTAAHCVNRINEKNFKVRAGEWDTSTDKETIPYQESDIAEIIKHDQFTHSNYIHDIALIILADPFILRSSIQTICLPAADVSSDVAQTCYATGWGATEFSNAVLRTSIMKKVELPVVPRSTCQTQLRKTRLGDYFQVHPTLMCAGGTGSDTCTGDGGSPLVCPYRGETNRYYQIGIVAGGIGCGEINVPGLYADVARHRNWIDEKMSLKNFATNYYVM